MLILCYRSKDNFNTNFARVTPEGSQAQQTQPNTCIKSATYASSHGKSERPRGLAKTVRSEHAMQASCTQMTKIPLRLREVDSIQSAGFSRTVRFASKQRLNGTPFGTLSRDRQIQSPRSSGNVRLNDYILNQRPTVPFFSY
jgi:hypothetical protein